jgi:hypothetical protein
MTMKRTHMLTLGLLVFALAVVPAFGDDLSRGLQRRTDDWVMGVDSGLPNPTNQLFVAAANGFSRVPSVLTPGRAWLRTRIVPGPVVEYELIYQLEGPIKDAFLYIGQPGANGAKAAALCVQNPPPGVSPGAPVCPPGAMNSVIGVILPEDLMPSAGAQGVHDLQQLAAAMVMRIVYFTVNTQIYPDGEVRGQLAPIRLGDGGGPGGIGGDDVSP